MAKIIKPGEQGKKVHVPIIMPDGQNVTSKMRREIMEAVVQAWFKHDPKAAKMMMWYTHEISKVQHRKAYKDKSMTMRIAFHPGLYNSLRRAFKTLLPDQPGFGEDDQDLKEFYQVAPKLCMGGARDGRGKGNKQ